MAPPNQSHLDSITKEIARHRKLDAAEAKKEADLLSKIGRAENALSKSRSTSTIKSKMKEIERSAHELAKIQKKRADLSTKIAEKSKKLRNYEARQIKELGKQRRKAADEERRLMREREAHERKVTSEIMERASLANNSGTIILSQQKNDFFISHASEDKEDFVRDLADALRRRGNKVWYDEFTLRVGDSLRRTIDRGLVNSSFGIVVLSEHFFRKEWTNRELDGLVALEVRGETRILPIWHKVSKDEVARYSPTLADKLALNSSLKSVEKIADELTTLVK